MATGTGKTVVMAMLIAWQTINKVVHAPRRPLREAVPRRHPGHHDPRPPPGAPARATTATTTASATSSRPTCGARCARPQIVITNYHAFLPRTAKEMQGVAANTRKILTDGKKVDPFVETADQIVVPGPARLRRQGQAARSSCSTTRRTTATRTSRSRTDEKLDKEDKERNDDARRLVQRAAGQIAKKIGIKTVYDLSATPYYLKGSGYNEGFIFPWVVSDFSLMDAIESGIVKVPRIPVDDDAAGQLVTYLRLWDHVGTKLPKRQRQEGRHPTASGFRPTRSKARCAVLYRSYAKSFARVGGRRSSRSVSRRR